MNTLKFRMLLTILLLLTGSYASFAQEQLKVSGVVKDTQSKPLVGVQVGVKGTSQNTYTDFEGKYSLTIVKGQTLVFSLQGMTSQEVTPQGAIVDIAMLREGEVASKEKKEGETPMNTNTRGQTSIAKEAKPLWVLNGVILQDEVDLR